MNLGRRKARQLVSSPVGSRHNSLTAGGSMTASGMKIRRRDGDTIRRLIQPWQSRAFAYYDLLGEIKFASQFYSRALGNLALFAAEVVDGEPEPVETQNPEAVAALARIQDPGGGLGVRSGLLASYGRLMFLVGEAYLFVSRDEDGEEQWEVLSPDELRVVGGTYLRYKAPSLIVEEYREPSEDDYVPVDDREAVAYRLWRRHPRYSFLADSTMQGVLDLAEELVLLTQAVRARARSRLAGSGILLVAEEISPAPLEPAPDEDPEEDVFLAKLTEAMMQPIVDEGTASAVVPIVVRAPFELIEKGIRHVQLVDPVQLYPETGLRKECVERIAIGLDMPPEVLLGLTDANHWCTDAETEALTYDRGWVTHDDLRVGDVIRTLDHRTGLAEWQPVVDIYRATVRDEKMRALESRTHSSLTTLAHRWPVLRRRWNDKSPLVSREWVTSDELRSQHAILTGAPSSDQPKFGIYQDDFVELVAWFWTEGNVRGSSISISQSHTKNHDRVARIRSLLRRFYGPASSTLRGSKESEWRESVQRNASSFGGPITVFHLNRWASAPLLEAAPGKRVAADFVCSLTEPQLELFIDVSCQADGHHYRNGHLDLWQKDARALDGYELAVILSGRAASRQPSHDGGTVVRALRSQRVRPVKASEEAERIGIEGATDAVVPYSGVVWCPTTSNGTWLARRRGRTFFTGNSAWAIDEQTWKSHLQPVAQQLVDDLTNAYFRPYLRDAGVAGWQRYCIAYDATEIINHPDRSKDAKDLYGHRAIGKKALRSANGFLDEDAPTKDELAEMIGVAVRDSSLAWDGIPSVKAGGLEPAPGVVVKPGDPAAGEEGAATGGEVEPGPAKADDRGVGQGPGVVAAARVAGAAELALLRAREAAGNRLRSYARRDPETAREVEGLRTGQIAAVLGREKVRALKAPAERELVAGVRDLIVDALRLFGITDPATVDFVVDTVERHAARTLYDERPAPISLNLPSTLA